MNIKLTEFKNEPYEDFSIPSNRELMEKAIKQIESESKRHYDLIIGGKKVRTKDKIISYNPSDPSKIIGTSSVADTKLAEKAVEAATAAFEKWKFIGTQERAEYLFKAAAIMRRRKMEIAATLVLEIGKNWVEAIADTAEGIDFLEYYGREMLRLKDAHELVSWPGELTEFRYTPLGVGVIIAPWNFPFAILAGMTTAAIVTGNTVVVKPASLTPIVGAKFAEIMMEAGLPDGVFNFIPGSGHEVGDYLVSHPKVRFINFTGSKDVGLRINEMAAKIAPGQKWIKRVAAEMGGKDALIIDSEANIDEAVEAATISAFGFQGQKCSALSRLIVDKKVYNEVVEKLTERTKRIKVGPVKNYENYLGPVNSESAEKKILDYIKIGKKEAKLAIGGKKVKLPGYFIEPTIFIDVDRNARIAQEEIFGPVLSVIKAKDFNDALEIANSTEYGLTGGVFTKNREKIEEAKRKFYIGNMYINRKITGAMVGVQPFGGYNMSGTCSKAGGRDYLTLFMQGKSISERL